MLSGKQGQNNSSYYDQEIGSGAPN